MPGCEMAVPCRGHVQAGQRRTWWRGEGKREGVGVPGCEGPSNHTTHFQAGQTGGAPVVDREGLVRLDVSRCRGAGGISRRANRGRTCRRRPPLRAPTRPGVPLLSRKTRPRRPTASPPWCACGSGDTGGGVWNCMKGGGVGWGGVGWGEGGVRASSLTVQGHRQGRGRGQGTGAGAGARDRGGGKGQGRGLSPSFMRQPPDSVLTAWKGRALPSSVKPTEAITARA